MKSEPIAHNPAQLESISALLFYTFILVLHIFYVSGKSARLSFRLCAQSSLPPSNTGLVSDDLMINGFCYVCEGFDRRRLHLGRSDFTRKSGLPFAGKHYCTSIVRLAIGERLNGLFTLGAFAELESAVLTLRM